MKDDLPKTQNLRVGTAKSDGLKTSIFSVILTVVARAVYILSQIIMAQSLGPEQFGYFVIAWTVAGLGIVFSSLGLPQTSVRYTVAGRHLWGQGYLGLSAISSCLVGGLIFATAPFVAERFFDAPGATNAIKALASIVPLTVICALLGAGFRTEKRIILGISVNSIGLNFGPFLAVAFTALFLDPTPEAFALGWSIGLTPTLLIALLKTRRSDVQPKAARTIEKLRFGIQSLGVHSVNIINMWVDRLMIGMLTTTTQLGLYQAASLLSMIPMMLGTTIGAVYEAKLAQAKTIEERSEVYAEAQMLQVHLVTPGSVLLIFTASIWLELFFGNEFEVSAPFLGLLLLGQTLKAWCGPALIALNMGGYAGTALLITGGGFVTNVGLNFWLIGQFGGLGAAIATMAVTTCVALLALYCCVSYGLIRVYLHGLFAALISTAGLIVIYFGLRTFFEQWIVFDFVLVVFLIAVYAILVAVVRVPPAYDLFSLEIRRRLLACFARIST
ncbi:MAG: oligosaccharide flippase family protein [Pseudomonadota bacterium]